MGIVSLDRSIIPACDAGFEDVKEIFRQTADVDMVGAYKVGVSLLDVGLKAVVDAAREYTDKPVIYDHQKAGTDIHKSTPDKFMDAMVRSGIRAVILFPQAGPVTQYEWTKAAQERGLGVIVGGEMTHPRYLDDDRSDGRYDEVFEELGMKVPRGYLRASAPDEMYELAARMNVTDFVVPGNKPERIMHYRQLVEGLGVVPVFYSPGLVAQGGKISEGAKAAGQCFHAIVGRGITEADNIRDAAVDLSRNL